MSPSFSLTSGDGLVGAATGLIGTISAPKSSRFSKPSSAARFNSSSVRASRWT